MVNEKWNGLITFFGTTDLEATDNFYRGLLGLKLYKDQGLCKIYEVSGGGLIGFCSHMRVTRDEQKKSPIITLLTAEVDEVYHNLLKAGISVIEPPGENEYFKIYHFFTQDPNGYIVEIQKFL